MTTTAEDVLFLSLTDTDALESLATIGLDPECIPTEEMRPVVSWALDRFFESGRTRAPSRAALLETWGQHVEDAKVELLPEDEDADTIQWAIDTLKSQFIHYQFQAFIRKSGTEMAAAATPDRVNALAQQADDLFSLSMRMQPRHMQAELTADLPKALAAYEARAREGHQHKGIAFGMPMVDGHTFGIHEGELAMLAAGPKTGKSYFLVHLAKEAWKAEEVSCLFTLENSVDMTIDRLACMHLGIDSRSWQRGQCSPEEVEKVRWFINDVLPEKEGLLHIIKPEPGKRTPAAMIRQAQMLGARRVFLDQTSHIEHPDPGRKPRHEIVGDILQSIKTLISTGAEPISCVLAHQINRAGVEAARKTGHLVMEHLAESAYAEREADWVFGLYQSHDDRIAYEALLQILAARREDTNAWKLVWRPALGLVAVSREVEIEL